MNVTSSLSGMKAAQIRLDVSGNNIANLNTQDFARQEVVQSTSVGGGTNVSIVNSAAGTGNYQEADIVQQLQSKSTYLANLAVFKAGNDMLGTLLNINS